jgi:hypothetical protein
MKKLSKMIIIALGLTLLVSAVASAKENIVATKAPITSTAR